MTAFFSFHTGGDYATYFGLDADTNRIATGGWSAGAYKYPIVCEVNGCISASIICGTSCFSLSSGSNVTKICNSVGFTVVDSTEGLLVRDNSVNILRAGANGVCSLKDFKACSHVFVCGSLSKASGCFSIAHPDPAKNSTHKLQHSFVESPTEGDNIYRWQV